MDKEKQQAFHECIDFMKRTTDAAARLANETFDNQQKRIAELEAELAALREERRHEDRPELIPCKPHGEPIEPVDDEQGTPWMVCAPTPHDCHHCCTMTLDDWRMLHGRRVTDWRRDGT